MVYNQPHRFYCGVDLHARTMFTHVLDHKGKTVFEQDLPADPTAFYGEENYRRLGRIKAQVDPDDLFRGTHEIAGDGELALAA